MPAVFEVEASADHIRPDVGNLLAVFVLEKLNDALDLIFSVLSFWEKLRYDCILL